MTIYQWRSTFWQVYQSKACSLSECHSNPFFPLPLPDPLLCSLLLGLSVTVLPTLSVALLSPICPFHCSALSSLPYLLLVLLLPTRSDACHTRAGWPPVLYMNLYQQIFSTLFSKGGNCNIICSELKSNVKHLTKSRHFSSNRNALGLLTWKKKAYQS